MMFIYCCDPSDTAQPDDAYRLEAEAAERLGIQYELVSFEVLVNEKKPEKAIRRVPVQTTACLALYRGWMLTPDQYRLLYDALAAKGVRLLNAPHAYRHCHYLPESYPVIEGHTPRTVWTSVQGHVSMDEVMHLLRPFGSAAVIVKSVRKK